jgi:molybdopterin molybdotransferase
MISVEEAIRIVQDNTNFLPVERIPLHQALGRVLAEPVSADMDLPPFNRAQMDGYALRSEDVQQVPARLKVVGEAAAGFEWAGALLGEGQAVRIMTGAPVPPGADSVQKVEVTREQDSMVEVLESTTPGQFIVPRASEIFAGSRVLALGETIRPASMAVLAAFGYSSVEVFRRPIVSVLATGSELVPVDQSPGSAQIRDSNSYSIGAYAEVAAAIVHRLPFAGDHPELLKEIIADAAQKSDAVILSGGVSMGVYDFTKTALRELGAKIFFDRVSLRPGKPTVFAKLGDTLVFGLPGNPVSVSVTFNLFARPGIRMLQGSIEQPFRTVNSVLKRRAKGSIERASYLPATLSTDEKGQLCSEPLKWGGSSDFVAFAGATALIIVPEGTAFLDEGSLVRTVLLPESTF